MNKYNVCLCILILVMLSGCKAVPDDVKSAAANYNDNEQQDDTELTYTDINGLQDSAIEALKLKPDNIILPTSVDFTNVSSINNITMEYSKNFSASKDEIADFFCINSPVWTKLEIPLNNEITYSYDSKSDEKYVVVSDNGLFSVILPDVYDFYLGNDTTTYSSLYESDSIINSNIDILLGGEKTTLKEQADYVQEWINNFKFREKDFTYRIKTVVSRNSDSNNILNMEIAKYFDGVLLDDCGGLAEMNNETIKLKSVGTSLTVTIAEKNSIGCFMTGSGTLSVKDTTTINQFLDLSSAINIVEKELSGFNTLNISEIIIMYTLEPVYDAEVTGANYQEPGGTVLCNPVYSFRIKKEYTDSGIAGINKSSMYYVINVDMVTGELVTNIDMNAYNLEE